MINRDYIFTLYGQGVRAVTRYIELLDQRVEDAEARVERSQQRQIDLLTKSLIKANETIASQKLELTKQRQLNYQLLRAAHPRTGA